MDPSFDSLTEVIVYAEDIDRLYSFYTEAFGLDPVEGAPEHGFVQLDAGGCALALHAGRDGDLGQYAPKLVFEVADLGAARDHLAERGAELADVRNPAPEVYVVDGRDPEGNRFSIESTTPPD